MRISNQMMADNLKNRLYQQTRRILETQTRITTGKRINKLSDDPVGVGQVLEYRAAIAQLEQYRQNIATARNFADAVDTTLEAVGELLEKAKDIAADPAPQMRASLAEQVAQIRQQVLQLANSKHNGSYMFSGHQTDTVAFDSAGTYNGDSGSRDVLIGQGMTVSLNVDGEDIFQGSTDVFQVLDDLQTALQTDDTTAMKTALGNLQQAVDQINGVRATYAMASMRMETADGQWASFKVNLEEMLSRTEDADLAEAAIDLQVQQTAYETSLAASARIIQPSLIDYLR